MSLIIVEVFPDSPIPTGMSEMYIPYNTYFWQAFSLAFACLHPFGGNQCWRLSAPPSNGYLNEILIGRHYLW